jgi:hypothetical protein
MVIVEENREYNSVIGDPNAPYINALAQQNGLATQWYGQSHPSLPNYLEMISGSTQGVTDDGTSYVFNATTVADELTGAGINWKAYMEDMPSPCYNGAQSSGYYKKHDPFMYFSSITGNPFKCQRVVPFTSFASDLQSNGLPSFAFVTPNICDDGHDCPNSTTDSWLKGFLPQVLGSPWYQAGGVVILTYDEGSTSSGCCGGAAGGHIVTIAVSTHGTATTLSTPGDHAGLLRTIESLYGIGYLGDSANPVNGDLLPLIRF